MALNSIHFSFNQKQEIGSIPNVSQIRRKVLIISFR